MPPSADIQESAATANFFWEGSGLGPLESGCIASFVKAGFRVNVFSYRNLEVPEGVALRDAAGILPEASLGLYCQAGQKRNLAAFSDAFRYHLLARFGGWWFDTDMLCIGEASAFVNLATVKSPAFCAGFEDREHINGAALFVADELVIRSILDDLARSGFIFDWGEIGPKLLTRVVASLELHGVIEPPRTFYPIHFGDFAKLYDPVEREWCEAQTAGALAVHLWNEIRGRLAIPSTLLPPQGSFVHAGLVAANASLMSAPTLSVETFRRLVSYPAMVQQIEDFLSFERRVRNSLPYRLREQLLGLIRSR